MFRPPLTSKFPFVLITESPKNLPELAFLFPLRHSPFHCERYFIFHTPKCLDAESGFAATVTFLRKFMLETPHPE